MPTHHGAPFFPLGLPPGWEAKGAFSLESPDTLDPSWLTMNLLQIIAPSGARLSISWSPERSAEPSGAYICAMAESPDDPVMTIHLRTREPALVLGWLAFMIKELGATR